MVELEYLWSATIQIRFLTRPVGQMLKDLYLTLLQVETDNLPWQVPRLGSLSQNVFIPENPFLLDSLVPFISSTIGLRIAFQVV